MTASAKRVPRQERSQATYERLLQVAGELLAEVGVERISTNLICARAGLTPPALYRYFADKYAVLEALGRRLMERQNAVLYAWLSRYGPQGLEAMEGAVAELVRATAEVTAAQPGSLWILRALRAVPQLAPVRLESHDEVAGRMVEVYAPLLPHLPRELLRLRLRIAVEFGFAADEMIAEIGGGDRERLIAETAVMLGGAGLARPQG